MMNLFKLQIYDVFVKHGFTLVILHLIFCLNKSAIKGPVNNDNFIVNNYIHEMYTCTFSCRESFKHSKNTCAALQLCE